MRLLTWHDEINLYYIFKEERQILENTLDKQIDTHYLIVNFEVAVLYEVMFKLGSPQNSYS